jgi:hypothetical protein
LGVECFHRLVIARIIPLAAIAIFCAAIPLHGQESVCALFSHLEGADGRHLVLNGDLIISKDMAFLGAADCDNRYRTPMERNVWREWPVTLSLHPSASVTPAQLHQFQDAAAEADRLRQAGKTVSASGSFSGRLHLVEDSDISSAELIFESFENLKVEALPDANTLPVIPICELFHDLPAWKGKRIAVSGDFIGTMEGWWITGSCEGGFVTDSYRWPVSLNFGLPAYYSSQTAFLYGPKGSPPPDGHDGIKDGTGSQDGDGRLNQKPDVAAATPLIFVGVLRMRPEYTTRPLSNGTTVGNGFGHLNGAAAELIVERVLRTLEDTR